MTHPQAFPEPLHERFWDLEQQKESSIAGMWIFLATEVLFFGGLFAGYVVFRYLYPEVYVHFGQEMDLRLGTLNTAVLLTSSLTMALAVRAVAHGQRKQFAVVSVLTVCLGALFLIVKLYEWHEEYLKGLVPGPLYHYTGPYAAKGELFFSLYFLMTGLHGIHVLIGIALIAVLTVVTLRRRHIEEHSTRIEALGLYWHFVDLVWIFLYPCFYLIPKL